MRRRGAFCPPLWQRNIAGTLPRANFRPREWVLQAAELNRGNTDLGHRWFCSNMDVPWSSGLTLRQGEMANMDGWAHDHGELANKSAPQSALLRRDIETTLALSILCERIEQFRPFCSAVGQYSGFANKEAEYATI